MKLQNHYLFAVVRYGLQDGAQRLETNGNIQQVAGKEEVVPVAKHGYNEVPHAVQEGLK